MALRTSTTSLPCPGALIPRSIIIELNWYKTDIRYSAEAHQYCSAQPSVFFHILPNFDVSTLFLNSTIKRLMCAVVVAASCLLSPDKKE